MSETAEGGASPLRRVVLASLVGTTIEWYDFFLYGTASALVFNKIFFPQFDPLTGTMAAFAGYALGFLARPLGGIVFGHFGDRIGRKKLLMISLVMMGVATFAIGLLPTYETLGVWAAVLLLALRLIQGFAVGGEWGGAVLLVAEHAPPERRAFWASWPQAGVPLGNLMAAGLLALMAAFQSEADFLAWGWRIPFLLSIVLIGIGYWIRTSVEETPIFAEAAKAETSRTPALEVMRERPGGIAIGAGLRVGENISYYVITAFSLTYVVDMVGLSRSVALNAVLIGAAAEFCAIPLFAALADRIGRKPVYAIGAIGMGIWAFAFFRLLDTGATPMIVAAMVVGLVLHGAMYGPQAAFISELFSTRTRYSGVSIAYQATSVFAGSLAPFIAIYLFKETQSAVPIAIYVAVACGISAIAAMMARETRGESFAEIDERHALAQRTKAGRT